MALKKHQIIVLPADENDSMALADIEQLAFDSPSPYALARNKKATPTTTTSGSNDENKDDKEQPISHGRMMFGPPSEEKQKNRVEKLNERLKAVPRDYYVYKAILKTEPEPEKETETEGKGEEDKIVGFAAWRFCADQAFPAENDWQDSEWEGCANPRALNDFFGTFAKLRVEFFGGKKVALLETLAVHPSAQGLGVGTKMLERGLEDAKKLGLKEAWLEASEAGYPLYQRFGWREVHSFVTDFATYGYEGSARVAVMKREEEEA